MNVNGYYINLDRSPERHAHMQGEARKAGIDWLQRFPAIDGRHLRPGPKCRLSPGGLACFLSHERIILESPADSFTFIFEDDVEISSQLPLTLHPAQLELLAEFDVVLLDCQPRTSIEVLSALWHCLEYRLLTPERLQDFGADGRISGVSLFDAAHIYSWGLSSYLVTPKGHRSLPPLMRRCLDDGPPGQWDILLRHACEDGRIKATVLAPFLATPLLDSYAGTTIDARTQSMEKLAVASAIRRMFFAGPISGIEAYARPLLEPAIRYETPRQLMSQLVARVFEISARDDGFVVG